MHQVWRLSEYRQGNLGLACTEDGLFLGRTPLIERQGARFSMRKHSEIEHLLSRAYGTDVAVDRLMSGLATVATALNANDPGLARIAAVHLRIPELPDQAARNRLEAEDILIKSIDRVFAAYTSGAVRADPDGAAFGYKPFPLDPTDKVYKASPDDPKHPRLAGRHGRWPGRRVPSEGRF
ncbi:MAG: hypothetical protein WA177_01905 [Xanthobacteraceae bacterium]